MFSEAPHVRRDTEELPFCTQRNAIEHWNKEDRLGPSTQGCIRTQQRDTEHARPDVALPVFLATHNTQQTAAKAYIQNSQQEAHESWTGFTIQIWQGTADRRA
jgi:hypothetical protein